MGKREEWAALADVMRARSLARPHARPHLWWETEGGSAVPVPDQDILVWAEWFGKADRKVGQTEVGSMDVSTVFLGVDHCYAPPGEPPLLYETMIFELSDGVRARVALRLQWRYRTREAAEEGHAEIVAAARAGDLSEVEPAP